MTAWSYSSLTAFETCPRRYEMTRITKVVQEPQSEAMHHGNEVHKALELNVRDDVPIPQKYKQYIPIVEAVKKAPGEKLAETKFGLTRDLKPTGYFAKDVWVRGVLDLTVLQGETAVVLDWKTGKPKSDPSQLELFAGAAFAVYPEVKTVRSGFVWLGFNQLDQHTYTRGQSPEIWSGFERRVHRMNLASAEGHYPPKPSGLCRAWCPVPNKLCEFSGKH